MKKFSLVFFAGLVMFTMFGCDNGGDNDALPLLLSGAAAGGSGDPELQGTWTSSCKNGLKIQYKFHGNTVDEVVIVYEDSNCQNEFARESTPFTYAIGNEIIDSIDKEKDKEIDFIDAFRWYSLYRIDGSNLYLNMQWVSQPSARAKTVKDVWGFVFVKE